MKLTDRIAQLEHDHTPPVPMGVIVVPHRSDRDACIAGELAKMPVPLGGDPLQQATAFREGEQGGRQLREPVQEEFRVDQAGPVLLQAVRSVFRHRSASALLPLFLRQLLFEVIQNC